MSETHINRDTIAERLARLDEEYGVDQVDEQPVDVDPERFPGEIEMARDGYDGSSYIWIVRSPEEAGPLTESMPHHAGNDRDRALMILGRGGDHWGVPGGGREAEESYEEAALREVREETSIECQICDVAVVSHECRTAPGYDEVLHNLRVVFRGQYESGSISIQPGELDGAAWLAERPRRVHPLVEPVADEWFDTEE